MSVYNFQLYIHLELKRKVKSHQTIKNQLYLYSTKCPRGEIGRHASLRGWCL